MFLTILIVCMLTAEVQITSCPLSLLSPAIIQPQLPALALCPGPLLQAQLLPHLC